MPKILNNKERKVGYYCPFTYPFLNHVDAAERIYLKEDDRTQIFLGSTKLCKRSTTIVKSVRQAAIDCILFVECCNVSSAVYSYIRTYYPEIRVIKMEISKNKRIYLKTFLDGFEAFEKYAKEISLKLLDKGYHVNVERKQENSIWCNYPVDLIRNYDGLALEEQLLFLFENVKCPILRFEQCNSTDITEHEGCLHKAYINSKLIAKGTMSYE